MTSYQPVENYGVIGDLNSVALVGLDASIDFLCLPDFDSPSIFAALLDKDKGGFFKITPRFDHVKHKQLYLPDTNILLTRFLSAHGVGEVTDFMPVEELFVGKELIRIVACIQGTITFSVECRPRFDYARARHRAEMRDEREIIFTSEGRDGSRLRLQSTVPLTIDDGDAIAEYTLQPGQKAIFMLEHLADDHAAVKDLEAFADKSLFDTIHYWKAWTSRSKYQGRWMEMVNRSALVLKLMTSHRHGSMVASPTFGLPEELGGERNWDYRYTWIRDASFTVYTLLKLGYDKEAREFMRWVEKQCKDIGKAGRLRLMYTLEGETEMDEEELGHLEGYKKSFPVRIGNAASRQIQLDIYGELLDAVYIYDHRAEPISYSFWLDLSRQVNWLCDHWHHKDEGIWEVRGGQKEFLYSRMMCWVAFDRAIKIAQAHSYPLDPRWLGERDNVFNSVHEEFWNDELKAFVQYKGATTVDAAALLMPLIRFIGPTDPKWLSTLKVIEERLVSDFLVFRYRANQKLDGLKGGQGTFSMCTFWYVECLSKSGQLDKAQLYFEKMLGYSNHCGLYAEMLGIQGEHLGNFPQAFTHLGLISAALNLNMKLDIQRKKRL